MSLHVPETRERSASTRSCNVDHFDHKAEKDVFGEKQIGFWGSFCLNLNNCMGPAMVLLPLLNQQAGWFVPLICMVLMFALSSLAATMLCDAMQRIPGNINFGHRFEFASTVRHFYGKKWYIAFQVFYNLSLQASNIAAMIISAQVVDNFIMYTAGHSYAFDYHNGKFIKSTEFESVPWCDGIVESGKCHGEKLQWIVSLGFIICMAICIPFGYLNLDDNMWFQWFSLVGLVGFTFEFLVQFAYNWHRHDKICLDPINYNGSSCTYNTYDWPGNYSANGVHRTPVVTQDWQGQAQVLGISVFAYAYVVTIPSWVNEKKPGVSVNKAIWVPALTGLFMKVIVGLWGAWAYQLLMPDGKPRPRSDDILNILALPDVNWKATIYSSYLWDITTLIPGVPVLAIMVKYNLLSGGVCGKYGAFFWGVVSPWIVTLFLYQLGALNTFCNWVSTVVSGYVNFVVPCVIYRTALLRYPDGDGDDDCGHDHHNINGEEGRPLLAAGEEQTEPRVCALPCSFRVFGRDFRINRVAMADFMIVFFTIASTMAIGLSVATAVVPQ